MSSVWVVHTFPFSDLILELLNILSAPSRWSDPGATAVGSPYGQPVNLSYLVEAIGVRSVDTSVPTDPSKQFGFMVAYQVIRGGELDEDSEEKINGQGYHGFWNLLKSIFYVHILICCVLGGAGDRSRWKCSSSSKEADLYQMPSPRDILHYSKHQQAKLHSARNLRNSVHR